MPQDFTQVAIPQAVRVWNITEVLGGNQGVTNGGTFQGPALNISGFRRFVLYIFASSPGGAGALAVTLAEIDPMDGVTTLSNVTGVVPRFNPATIAFPAVAAWKRFNLDDTAAGISICEVFGAIFLTGSGGVTTTITNVRLFAEVD